MNSIKRLCLIIAMALTMDAFITAPAFSQQGEVAALNAKVMALYRASTTRAATVTAQPRRVAASIPHRIDVNPTPVIDTALRSPPFATPFAPRER